MIYLFFVIKFPKINRKFFTKKRIIIGAIAIVMLFWIFISNNNKKTVVPQFITVQKQDIKQEISASGVLTGKTSINLHFKSSGKLVYLGVKVGDPVYAWQTIASLDTEALATSLRQAENTLRDKRAIVDKVKNDLKGSENTETYTQRQTRTTAEVAQDNAYDSMLEAKRALTENFIFSPISGTVTRADAIAGQLVSSSDIIAQVVDFSEMIFETDVDEADISKIEVGQKAEVTLNAYGEKRFPGEVVAITPSTKTTSNGATVVAIKISLNDTTISPITGLNGQADIIQAEKKNVLVVPLDAIGKNNTVLVKTGTTFRAQKVTTGFKNESDVEIKSGLYENDQVVSNRAEVTPTLQSSVNPILGLFRRR